MADFNYDGYDSAYDDTSAGGPGLMNRARRWVNISGAVCSVGLIVGLTFWGYKLAVRDVTGVPVMRAATGAMRMAPLDPGGEQALNQGLTVNAIAAMGTTAPTADTIILAPQAVSLLADDLPNALESATVPVENSVPAQPGVSLDATVLTEVSATTADVFDTLLPDPVLTVPNDPNALRVSLRPQARPASLTAVSAPTGIQDLSAFTSAAVTALTKELDPTTIPAGTRLAQLGAYETPKLARTRFSDLQLSLGDLMTGKDMVVQAAQSGGRTFYRLRAHGFANDEDVRRFCAALMNEETDCIPVAQR